MRKTLLIATAALAASVISSQAQVYSQNIVGNVNTPLPTGFVNIANPLDASGSNNSITNVINVFSGTYDGAGIYIWNGAGYSQYTIDSGWSSGIGNAADTAQVNPPPTLAPGVGIFINNTTGNSNTLTFVGTVLIDSAGASTNVVGIVTNHLATGFTFVASKLPIAGGLNCVMQLPVASTLLDGAGIYVPNIFGVLFMDSSNTRWIRDGQAALVMRL